ncbi:MAG: hypothetical protein ABI988_07460 [Nitrospirota bacterium]
MNITNSVSGLIVNEEGVVIINQSDFHEEKHELVEATKKSEKGEKDGKSNKKWDQWA